jgi:hypothetical protein
VTKVEVNKKKKLKHPFMHGTLIFSVVFNNAQASYHQINNLRIRQVKSVTSANHAKFTHEIMESHRHV